jgi:hypothetical protein
MASGSRAGLTLLLSDHPHPPARHSDGALTSRLGRATLIPPGIPSHSVQDRPNQEVGGIST